MKSLLLNLVLLLCLSTSFSSIFANPDLTDKNQEALEVRNLEIERSNIFWRYLIETRKNNKFDTYLPLTGGTLTGNLGIGSGALSGGGAANWLTLNGSEYSGGNIFSVNGVAKGYTYYYDVTNGLVMQGAPGVPITLQPNSSVNALRLNIDGTSTFFNALTGTSATFSGVTTSNGLALSSNNVNRYPLFFATPNDFNHALYNNYPNLDGEGSWDGLKMNTYGGLHVRVGSNRTSALYVSDAGKIGIGTTSPQMPLHVQNGAVGSNIARFTNGGGGGGTRGISIYSNDSYVKLQVSDNAGSIADWAHLTLNPEGGNVGIGTTSPSDKLSISGNGSTATLSVNPGTGTYASYKAEFNSQAADEGFRCMFGGFKVLTTEGYNTPEITKLYSNNTETIALNNGNVGIGTSNPQGYKLAVAGNVIAESVKVALQGNWPDYVFKPGNKLLPLQEVEKYVQENNHLPEMPSEAEVKKEGIDLGQMDAKLLNKIEELTLYMIEQNKLILLQNERIANLEKQIK